MSIAVSDFGPQVKRDVTGQYCEFDALAAGSLKKVGDASCPENNQAYHRVVMDGKCRRMTYVSAVLIAVTHLSSDEKRAEMKEAAVAAPKTMKQLGQRIRNRKRKDTLTAADKAEDAIDAAALVALIEARALKKQKTQ